MGCFVFVGGSASAVDIGDWGELLSYRPDEAAQTKLLNRKVEPGQDSWHIQKLERARGDVLLESQALVVTKLPAVGGKVLTPQGLLAFVRRNLSMFLDGEGVKFGPVTDEDRQHWETESPSNAVVELTSTQGIDNRQSAWLVTGVKRDEWLMTAVQVGGATPAKNPYSGNRKVGVASALPMEGCILYTRAALRAYDAPSPTDERALADQSSDLWKRLFSRIKVWVESNGGAVVPGLGDSESTIVPWLGVAKTLHVPKIAWQDLDGMWRSKDVGKRFAIVFRGLDAPCEFIERNKEGEELRVQIPLKVIHGEKDKQGQAVATYVLERSNEDPEVLSFYDFSAALVQDIIASKPKPSRLVLKRVGDKLTAEWLGIAISRDASGRLAEIKQPGDQPGRAYDFAPEGP
ncbi:MAG: hypothetical protein JNJ83_17510 [Verrucomicrobiaceae bacterium]|nr:hypothetical protein [Verrucomicrobiaceae bacterium]